MFYTSLVVFLWTLVGVFGAEVKSVSVMEGDSVTLYTHITELQSKDVIEWRFEEIRIARIKRSVHINPIYEDNDKTQRFRDRLKINNQTGDLTITNIRSEHTGLYQLYIDIGHQETVKRFNVTVNAVPTVSIGVFGNEVKSVSVLEGESVTLYTDITEIQSKDVIEWWLEEIRIVRIKRDININPIYEDNDKTQRFRDRLKMNNQTGDLIITNITTQHTGLYQLYINFGHQEPVKRFNVTVNAVPTVSIGVFGDEVKSVSVMEGDSVTLYSNITKIQSKDVIEWRFEEIRIVRIKRSVNINPIYEDNDETQRFRHRLKMNNQTGDLIIIDIRSQHTGLYQLNIYMGNKKTLKRFNVYVSSTVSITESPQNPSDVFGDEVKSVSVMEGESVTLYTDITEIQRGDEIEWMFNEIRIARIKRLVNINPIYENNENTQIFRDRLKMNNQTGDLIITNITTQHTGLYQLQLCSKK